MDKKLFIEKCKRIHNHKYEYNIDSDDVKTRDKIEIVCPKHGTFNQKVWSHISGSGCTKCYNESIPKKIDNSRELFIDKSTNP